ncbi:hypothetical protein [Stratiformator vulcanicus]|uniref:Uncharacterized protein n=1 Tax=Stratiformator vulcanicus TaxID=2527980 RepID=A0A517R781_9PLAN|nr:hypothetical protein [Stratiformator vulcanicus]QDT39754.1 hypothetical protein Pan189_41630 [Stratiformator vulcanicus]
MAVEWIMMRKELPADPDVIAMSTRLDVEEDLIVGKLHRFWSWADSHSETGNALSVTPKWIDRHVHLDGFADAMIAVGWLAAEGDGAVTIPNFERFLGTSSKKRAKSNRRVAQHREKKRNRNGAGNGGVTGGALPEALPDKKREYNPPNPPGGASDLGKEGGGSASPRPGSSSAPSPLTPEILADPRRLDRWLAEAPERGGPWPLAGERSDHRRLAHALALRVTEAKSIADLPPPLDRKLRDDEPPLDAVRWFRLALRRGSFAKVTTSEIVRQAHAIVAEIDGQALPAGESLEARGEGHQS